MAVETESVEYDTFEVSTKKTSLRYSLEESEEIIPLTDIREEVIRRGTIRLEPVEVEDSVSSFSQSDSGLLTRLQHRRSTITEGEGLGIEQEFHSTQLRRLSRKATSRVVSDSSGRLVPIDDELVETILGVSSREFENELRACFNSHDNDKDGRISHHELYLCTYEQGFPFGKDAVRAVMEIAGSPDGTMDFSQFAKFNYDILNVQLELKQESENEGMSASGSLFRRPTKERTLKKAGTTNAVAPESNTSFREARSRCSSFKGGRNAPSIV